jgi:hypothetical protein
VYIMRYANKIRNTIRRNSGELIYRGPRDLYKKKIQLLHLIMNTRPDIAFVIKRLAQFISNPNYICWVIIKYLLRYLRGTRTKEIIYELRPNWVTTNKDEENGYIETILILTRLVTRLLAVLRLNIYL